MMIDIPVFIAFDCSDGYAATVRRNHQRVFTMRFDTDDGDKPAQFCTSYPPTARSHWSTDKDGVLFAMFSRECDEAIKRRAGAGS